MKAQELETLLKELNLKESDIDRMWKFCQVFSHPFTFTYMNWRNLTPESIKKIPRIYKNLSKRVIHGNKYSIK